MNFIHKHVNFSMSQKNILFILVTFFLLAGIIVTVFLGQKRLSSAMAYYQKLY